MYKVNIKRSKLVEQDIKKYAISYVKKYKFVDYNNLVDILVLEFPNYEKMLVIQILLSIIDNNVIKYSHYKDCESSTVLTMLYDTNFELVS